MCSSICETPMISGVSLREAARTHAPKATDRTPGMCSESTVKPFERTVRRSATSSFVANELTPGCDLQCHVEHGCADDADDRFAHHAPNARSLHPSAHLHRCLTRMLA